MSTTKKALDAFSTDMSILEATLFSPFIGYYIASRHQHGWNTTYDTALSMWYLLVEARALCFDERFVFWRKRFLGYWQVG